MNNKDLFKQAIAEAKTIREAAITNAKEALEESLTPHLKEMLAQKLQEMENEENVDEYGMEHNDRDLDGDGKVTAKDTKLAEEEEEEETPEVEAEEGEEEEELEIEDMSVEDLKNLIRDIVAQETGQEELGQEDMPVDDMTGSEEEIDINELLAELEGKDGEETLNENVDLIAYAIEQIPVLTNSTAAMLLGTLGAIGVVGASAVMSKINDLAKTGVFGKGAKSGAENLAKLGKDAAGTRNVAENEEEVEEGIGSAIKGGLDKFDKWIGSTSDKMAKVGQNSKMVQSLEKGVDSAQDKFKKAGLSNSWNKGAHLEEESQELYEALSTIKTLRGQLQEVNLLNAKLLYVNKVFKSTNLSEGQKVNVIAAFDKAETVREVKLVFETVSKNVVAKKATSIKEHTSFASKATGTTAAPQKEVINEVSEQVLRMQKLAGIIK